MISHISVGLFALSLLVIPALSQSQVWGQCGGIGWTGPTTCVAGTVCTFFNAYYSQCLPGTSTPPPVSSSATQSTAPTSTSSSAATSSTGSSAPGACPTTVTLPASITLTSDTFLNDPFTFLNGSKVVTKTDWACRQQEINLLFQRYELGTLPPAPSSLTSSLSGNNLTINASQGGKSISFVVTITYPAGNGPFPAIIGIGGISIPTPAGVAVINFNNDDMALQNDGTSRGVGKFYTLYGTNATAGAMTAWAWGVSRIIDALEMTAGNAKIDLTRLAVSGCSRNGKGALVAGAFEPRIWLTIPQESGSGGAGSWRISNAMLAAGQDTQTAPEIVQENVWFSPVFNQYVNQVNNLPFDHHMLSALVSPRPLFVIDNTDYVWLGPESVWGAQVTANKVWQALGIPDLMGVSQIGGHLHCSFPSSQQADLNAFVNRFLFGQAANTSILRTDGGNGASSFVSSSWVNWAVPTLT